MGLLRISSSTNIECVRVIDGDGRKSGSQLNVSD
jgi:hypothetical protein